MAGPTHHVGPPSLARPLEDQEAAAALHHQPVPPRLHPHHAGLELRSVLPVQIIDLSHLSLHPPDLVLLVPAEDLQHPVALTSGDF